MNPKNLTAAILFGGIATVSATAASAMPISPKPEIAATTTLVDWQCGPGWHITPWGRCAVNAWIAPVPVVRPYGWYAPRPFYRPYGWYGPRFHRW
ncbi:MAG: hypothetical protein J0I16_14475 [Rhizobiales bacterium]|nr:hypothetical protein [Hyphomicrobiales bacterium]